jgi:O-antigen/teichoic acid export membrane protein
MGNELEKKAFKNILLGYVSFFLNLAQTILLVPILISAWGKEMYGIWLAIFAAFTLLQTLDTGHQIYVGNEITILHHSDKQKAKLILGSALSTAYFLGLLEFIVTLILILSKNIDLLISTQNHILSQNYIVLSLIILVLMWMIFGSVGGVLVRLLIPLGLLYELQWMGIIMRLSQFLSLIAVAYAGGGILMASIYYAIVQSIISIVIIYYIKKHTPEYYPWWKYRSFKQAISNLKKSLIITINTIIQQFSSNGIILFISYFFSPAVVPAFTTVRTLTNTSASVTNIVSNALVPDIAKFHAFREPNKIKNVIYTNWFLMNTVVSISIFAVLPFIDKIYKVWTHGQLEFNFTLFLLLVSAVSFTNFGTGIITYLTVINNIKAQTYIIFVRTIIIFSISYFFIGSMKLVAVGVSILIAEIVASFIIPVYFFYRVLKTMNENLDKDKLFLAILPSFLILISIVLIENIRFNIIFISSFMIILLIVHSFIYWKFLDSEVKQRLKIFIVNIIRIKK